MRLGWAFTAVAAVGVQSPLCLFGFCIWTCSTKMPEEVPTQQATDCSGSASLFLECFFIKIVENFQYNFPVTQEKKKKRSTLKKITLLRDKKILSS